MDIYDLVFVISAVLFNLLIAGVFITTKKQRPDIRQALGICLLLLAIPLVVVFIHKLSQGWNIRVVIWLPLVLLYLLVEFLLDFVLKIDFRTRAVTHVPYILLEYAALFGLIFIAVSIGKVWGYVVGVFFWLLMGCLIYLYSDQIFRKKVKAQ
jgi:hypothetical protein